MQDNFEDPLVGDRRGADARARRRGKIASAVAGGLLKLCLVAALGFISYYLAVLVGLTREALDTTRTLSRDWSGQFDLFLAALENGTGYISGIEHNLELLGACVRGFCAAPEV